MIEIEKEIRFIDQWIAQNNLDVGWENDKTFWIDNIRYLYLRHKEEDGEKKIFSPDFTFLIDPDELEEFMNNFNHKVDYYCFEFGGKVYYSPVVDKPELHLFKHIGKAKDISGFDYLGIHSGYELCIGSRTYDDWCRKAKFLGITTLGICEKHTLAGALKFQLACAKNKIRSVIGETISIKGKDEKDYKVKIYVANQQGWKNLLRIHKILNIDNEGKFIDQIDLIKHSEGLYCVFQHDTMLNEELLIEYYESNFIKTYFQLDCVEYKAEKRELYCLSCLKQALQLNVDLILICDSYYLDQEDSRVKQILQFIGNTGFEYQSDNQHFKSLEDVSIQILEMFETKGEEFGFSVLEKALNGLREVSEGCNFNIELGKTKLPKYLLTQEEKDRFEDTDTFFWYLVEQGLQKKVIELGKNQETYVKRIETEYDVISRGGFVDYFLILNDIVRWCESQDILVGAGRGSGAGSLIAYLLDLVHVDPLEHDLIFERFLNEGRIGRSLPDLDTDIAGSRRDEVKRYVESKYGVDNVCSIGTYGTFRLKAAFRDLCRVKGIPPQTVNYVAATIEREDDFSELFIDASKSSLLKDFINEYDEVANDIDLIFGQPKNASIHAAGIVITPSDEGMTIYDWMPTKKMDGVLVSEWEGPELEAGGFLKEDLLGIKQLDKFSDIFKLIKQQGKEIPTFESIDYNNKKVLDLFKKGWNQDLFHFGSVGLTSYSQDVKPDSFEELVTMIALYRPGAMEFGAHENYVRIKNKKREPEYDWGTEEIMKSTYGLYTYQEQAMKICQSLAGFSLTEADDIRKWIGKKQIDKLAQVKDRFVRGCMEKGCPEYEAIKIWSKIEAFGSYAFNRCISGAESFYRAGNNVSGRSSFKPTIEEMYKIKNDLSYAKSIKKKSLHSRYKRLGYGTAFSLNEKGRLIKNRIKDIRYEGIRTVYEILLQNGRSIRVTENHKFPTLCGERRADELSIGDKLYINLGYEKEDLTPRFNTGNDNFPKKGERGFQTRDTSYTRLAKYRQELLEVHEKCQDCEKIYKRFEVHHIDGNHLNNDNINNLRVLCSGCHKKAEYRLGRRKMGEKGLLTGFSEIIKIEYVGEERVYDVEMKSPYHTFTTQQGIVTCNSHSVVYATTGYFCQHLKHHYPMEFWTISLQYAEEDEIPQRVSEIRKFKNITILPPDINHSQRVFTSDFNTNTIYWSLGKIKFAGETAVSTIIEEREKNGQFFDIDEFVSRINKSKVNKRVVTNLILAGCFDQLHKVEVTYQRKEILKKFLKEDYSSEYDTRDLFFWFKKQREVSGSGYYDYGEAVSNSLISFAPQRYLTPDRILVMENLDKTAVVAGLLTDVLIKNSKKGEFGQLIIDHNNEIMEVTLWNESWIKYKSQLAQGINKGIIVLGKVTADRYRKKNILHSIEDTVIEFF